MEENKKCACGMPLSEKTQCNCQPDKCAVCCECADDCACGCKAKADAIKAENEKEA